MDFASVIGAKPAHWTGLWTDTAVQSSCQMHVCPSISQA